MATVTISFLFINVRSFPWLKSVKKTDVKIGCRQAQSLGKTTQGKFEGVLLAVLLADPRERCDGGKLSAGERRVRHASRRPLSI